MRDDLKKIYKKEQTENIIIVRCEPNKKKKHSNFILKFIEYIAKYFTVKYYVIFRKDILINLH